MTELIARLAPPTASHHSARIEGLRRQGADLHCRHSESIQLGLLATMVSPQQFVEQQRQPSHGILAFEAGILLQ